MPATSEWVTQPSVAKKKKVKLSRSLSTSRTSHGNARSIIAGKPDAPTATSNPFAVLGDKDRIPSGNPPEAEEKTPGDPTHPVEELSPSGLQETRTPPPSLDEEEGEVTNVDADIHDSIARALLDALQDKRR